MTTQEAVAELRVAWGCFCLEVFRAWRIPELLDWWVSRGTADSPAFGEKEKRDE